MNEEIVALLHKCVTGAPLIEAEQEMLDNWIAQSPHHRKLYDEVMDPETLQKEVKKLLNYDSKALWNKISRQMPLKKNRLISIFNRPMQFAAAAIFLILISTAVYFMITNPAQNQQSASVNTTADKPTSPDISPGTEKAVLILDDGTNIILDNTANGEIARQGNAVVLKEDGLLAYNPDNTKPQAEIQYNTIKTVRGQHFSSLVLSDGTKVWLNAASSIHFPAVFTGKERAVEVTGEVYFEVAKNTSMPFRVTANGMKIEVLGTQFNVNAFDPITKTTLVEGSVKIISGKTVNILKPGQQAQLSSSTDENRKTSGNIKVIDDVDVEQVISWKNGSFLFKKSDMETIMEEVSRWYNIDIVFEDKIPGHFVASLSRNVPVSKLLKILELTGDVRFEIDGSQKRIVVKK